MMAFCYFIILVTTRTSLLLTSVVNIYKFNLRITAGHGCLLLINTSYHIILGDWSQEGCWKNWKQLPRWPGPRAHHLQEVEGACKL